MFPKLVKYVNRIKKTSDQRGGKSVPRMLEKNKERKRRKRKGGR